MNLVQWWKKCETEWLET